MLDGKIYVVGGITDAGATASVIRLDLSNPTGAWDDAGVTDLPYLLSSGESAVYGDSIYVVGGYQNIYGTPNTLRFRFENNPEDTAQLLSLGRTVNVTYPRYGYDAGRPMKIIGAESDYSTRTINLELWG